MKRIYHDQKSKEHNILQWKLNQLVLKHHLHVVFLLIRHELQCKLFVMNFISISATYLKRKLNTVDVDHVSMDISCSEPIAECAHSNTNSKAPKSAMTMKFINMSLHLLRFIETIKTFKLLKKILMQILNYLKRVLRKK